MSDAGYPSNGATPAGEPPDAGPDDLEAGRLWDGLGPYDGFVGLLIAVASTIAITGVVAAALLASGVSTDSIAFKFLAGGLQVGVYVAVAWVFARRTGSTTRRLYGLNGFAPRALMWLPVCFASYFLVAVVYGMIVSVPESRVPLEFGADQGAAAAVGAGILIVGLAPFAEEVFFRGLLFGSLRTRLRFWPAALVSAALFAALHFDPLLIVPLAALGVVAAWLYERSGSIWPPVFLHAINNGIAFTVFLVG